MDRVTTTVAFCHGVETVVVGLVVVNGQWTDSTRKVLALPYKAAKFVLSCWRMCRCVSRRSSLTVAVVGSENAVLATASGEVRSKLRNIAFKDTEYVLVMSLWGAMEGGTGGRTGIWVMGAILGAFDTGAKLTIGDAEAVRRLCEAKRNVRVTMHRTKKHTPGQFVQQ